MVTNILYEKEICSFLSELVKTGEVLSIKNLLPKMSKFIIEKEKKKDIDAIKRIWSVRIYNCAKKMNISLRKSIADWEPIAIALNQGTKDAPIASPSSTNSYSTSASTNASKSNSTNKNKNYVLSSGEKQNILDIYNGFRQEDMWELSTGKVVENEMKELAGKSKYSHPVHSFIMDPCDPVWKTFFTKDELDEIIKFDQMQLPALPDNWNQCIDAFKNLSSTSAIYQEAIKQLNSSQKEHDEKWILHSIINILDLYTYNILSTDMSEADILNKVWGFIYKGFYHGIIDPKLGEVSSSSSSLNQNQYRSLETINPRKRKITGRKVDILFKYGSMELGCTEVGRDSAPTDDKYIDDGMKKAPIALKDMLSVMVDNDEVMKKKLSSIGVIIMGLKIQILIMDAPAGKICRLTKSDFFNFPRSVEVFYKDFKPLLQIVHILKSIMINNINTINENTTTKSVTLPSTSLKPLLIPPSFIPSDSSSPSSPTSSSPCKVSRIKTDD